MPVPAFSRASAGDAHWQGFVAFDKTGIHPLRFANHLNIVEALQDFLPDDLQLQLGQPEPDATMNPEAERDVGARPGPVDDELVGAIDRLFVAVARDVPHHDLVTLLELFAAELYVLERGPAHMRQGRLPAD